MAIDERWQSGCQIGSLAGNSRAGGVPDVPKDSDGRKRAMEGDDVTRGFP